MTYPPSGPRDPMRPGEPLTRSAQYQSRCAHSRRPASVGGGGCYRPLWDETPVMGRRLQEKGLR